MAKAPTELARKVSGELVGDGAGESLAIGLTRAEVDQQIATAKANPRTVSKVIEYVTTLATLDEEGAASMIYEKPQGGEVTRGASIRFAELLAQGWGNARVASRTVHIDTTEKFVEAEGIFHDLETNLATVLRVRRPIRKKNGDVYSEDMIITVANAAGSIARRNAILAGIPRPVWRGPYEAAQQVIRGELGTLAKRRSALLNYLKANKGIEPARALAAVGLTNEADMNLDHFASLRVRAEALKNGDGDLDELFPQVGALAAPAKTNIAAKVAPKTELPKTKDPADGGFNAKGVEEAIKTAEPAKEETKHDADGVVIEGETANAGASDSPEPEGFSALALIEGRAPRGESYTLISDDDDGKTLPLYIDGVEVGRVTEEDSGEYNAYSEHAFTDDEAAAEPQAETEETAAEETQAEATPSTDLPDGWEVLKDVDGPAPISEEFYLLAGDQPDPKTGRLPTYLNGRPASSCTKKGAAEKVRYTAHPVTEGGKEEPEKDEGFPGDKAAPAVGQDGPDAGDDGEDLPGAFGEFWAAAFGSDLPWPEFVSAWGALNKSTDWLDEEFTEDDKNAFRGRIAAELLVANRLPDVTSNITAFRLWMEFATDVEVISEKWRELKQSEAWAKFKPERQAEFRATVEARIAKLKES